MSLCNVPRRRGRLFGLWLTWWRIMATIAVGKRSLLLIRTKLGWWKWSVKVRVIKEQSGLLFAFRTIVFRLMPINLVFSRSRLMIRRTAFIHRMLSLLLVKRDISVAGIRILVSRKPIARMISVLCVVVKPVCGLSFANMINRWINIWIWLRVMQWRSLCLCM